MSNSSNLPKTPISVFTGYLGSGKTTIILNLIKQLQDEYQVVWLKNEYGDDSIDSVLAKENNIKVTEMMNGCLCCVLVGKLHDAVEQILRDYHPDRIIIESSGTAYPMPIVMEIKRIPGVQLDSVINVIDALNFNGYHDKGYVAKMQAGYTDLIVINKVGLVDEVTLDQTLDDVYELNPGTPKIRTTDGNVQKDLLIGLDSKLANIVDSGNLSDSPSSSSHHHPDEVEVFTVSLAANVDVGELESYLSGLKSKGFIRIKGVVNTDSGLQLLNWVYGRTSWQKLQNYAGPARIVFMGQAVAGRESEVKSNLQRVAS
ncbi:GTP-binding protein [Candidatus Dojkabacteria bacterium]|uniref:GTP-binding protein n=1 Tax=Candidatus Dojkabacteria bacterium TaxID=2099670 RepID=A0A955KYW5_9BACT|nr:GTP-binding protein [Candidatus Dojkabacteria bacterium]